MRTRACHAAGGALRAVPVLARESDILLRAPTILLQTIYN
jgi:hypothetical protein